jgi:hypothetical protein
MNWSLELGATVRRVYRVFSDQAPVLLPAAFVVFVCGAIIDTPLAALASALTLIAVVMGLAWTSSPR